MRLLEIELQSSGVRKVRDWVSRKEIAVLRQLAYAIEADPVKEGMRTAELRGVLRGLRIVKDFVGPGGPTICGPVEDQEEGNERS